MIANRISSNIGNIAKDAGKTNESKSNQNGHYFGKNVYKIDFQRSQIVNHRQNRAANCKNFTEQKKKKKYG